MAKIKRNAFRCKRCGMVVESKSVHDYQQCACGNFTDGGLEYIRRGGNLEDMEDMSEMEKTVDREGAISELNSALDILEQLNRVQNRSISIAIARVEEAILWLEKDN